MSITSQVQAIKQSGGKRFDLSCGLKEFPAEIYELADTLEILDLSGNHLSDLPHDLWKLHKLRILFCSDNLFTHLPEVLGKCPQLSMLGFKANKIKSVPPASLGRSLRWLILTDNQIDELPAAIGQCTQLQKLMLSGNQLKALPRELESCTRLELIRIAANHFTALPSWIVNLPKLSWLAFAGNPCSEENESKALLQNPIREINWRYLNIKKRIGEGASGVIHQAEWKQSNEAQLNVAVKLFKGNMTSDGLPHSEKTACISAGFHPNLIDVYGKLHDHPHGIKGLVMSLINPDFTDLAKPPSLDSCTRDIYASDIKFTLKSTLLIAHGIASAAQQLHAKGIMHGDLYAHNILHNGDGNCLLGDFGAASFYSLEDKSYAEALQRIEIRAFGCLLQELIERCDELALNKLIYETLFELQADCTREIPAQRPLFNEILKVLEMQLDKMALAW